MQVRDVAARDQQHHADRAEQHENARAIVADELVAKPRRLKLEVRIVFRKVAPEPHGHRLELRVGALARHARLQTAVDGEIVLVVEHSLCRRERDRRPQVFLVRREIERGRHHAGDEILHAVHPDLAAGDRRIAAEAARPQVMAEHDDALVPRTIFVVGERASDLGAHAEHVEEVRRYFAGRDSLGRHAVRQVLAHEILGGQSVESGRTRRCVHEVADRHR